MGFEGTDEERMRFAKTWGLVPVAEAFVCGGARVTTVLRKPPLC